MRSNKLLLYVIVLLGLVCCVISQKCSVTLEGYHFDVSKLIQTEQDYKYTSTNGDIYYFNLCNNTVGANPCGNDMIGYKFDSRTNRCYGLGSNREYYSLHNVDKSGPSLIVSYRGGDQIPNNPRSRYELSYVFHCDPNSGEGIPKVNEPNEYGVVIVHWYSKYGCLDAYSQLIVNKEENDEKINNQLIKNANIDLDPNNYFVKKTNELFNEDENNEDFQNKQEEEQQQVSIQKEDNNEFIQQQIKQQEQEEHEEGIYSNDGEFQNKHANVQENQETHHEEQHEQPIVDQPEEQIQPQQQLQQFEPVEQQQPQPQPKFRVTNTKTENPFSPAFFEKVLSGIKDLDKMNMENNNKNNYPNNNIVKRDEEEDYLDYIKNTYKTQNQFQPPQQKINNEKNNKNNEQYDYFP